MKSPLRLPSEYSDTCPAQEGRFEKKRPTQKGRSERWFARVPASVLLDAELSAGAKAAHAAMALPIEKGQSTVKIGMRLLGRLTEGRGKTTALRWIAELERRGHIMRQKGASGARNTYSLSSPVFATRSKGSRQGVDTTLENVAEDESTLRQPVQIQHCSECRRPVKQLGKTGWCRTCVHDANLVRDWMAAKADLGPNATEEEIAHRLHLEKITARMRKILRRAAA